MNFFRGTSYDQDNRFKDKQNKLMKQMQFPSEFDQKVDMKQVRWDVMKPWVLQRINELMGIEDDVLVSMVFNVFEADQFPNIKELQINLTGFMASKAKLFCTELWNHLLGAQSSGLGVPPIFLEKKKKELLAKKV